MTLKGFRELSRKQWLLLDREVDSSQVTFLERWLAFVVVEAQKTDHMGEVYYFPMWCLWDWQLWCHVCLASSYLSLLKAALQSISGHDLPLELASWWLHSSGRYFSSPLYRTLEAPSETACNSLQKQPQLQERKHDIQKISNCRIDNLEMKAKFRMPMSLRLSTLSIC